MENGRGESQLSLEDAISTVLLIPKIWSNAELP
jgi:hypothetical protein